MHYLAWRKIEPERKARGMGLIRAQFDLTPHMQSDNWPDIYKGIQQQLAKIYTDNKSTLKKEHWVAKPDGTCYIRFWLDPKNVARAAQNRLNRAKSTIICRQGSRSLDALRDQMMESSATREYPSLIQTYFDMHTVDGVFVRDEERILYEEMPRLRDLGSNTPSGVPYTDDEINTQVRGASSGGTFPVVRSDDKFSQMLTQLESQPQVGSGSGSDGGGDDEDAGDHEDADGDEDN
ncbi:probable flavin-containing monooxygenase 1 [Tanacetum coccineum]